MVNALGPGEELICCKVCKVTLHTACATKDGRCPRCKGILVVMNKNTDPSVNEHANWDQMLHKYNAESDPDGGGPLGGQGSAPGGSHSAGGSSSNTMQHESNTAQNENSAPSSTTEALVPVPTFPPLAPIGFAPVPDPNLSFLFDHNANANDANANSNNSQSAMLNVVHVGGPSQSAMLNNEGPAPGSPQLIPTLLPDVVTRERTTSDSIAERAETTAAGDIVQPASASGLVQTVAAPEEDDEDQDDDDAPVKACVAWLRQRRATSKKQPAENKNARRESERCNYMYAP